MFVYYCCFEFLIFHQNLRLNSLKSDLSLHLNKVLKSFEVFNVYICWLFASMYTMIAILLNLRSNQNFYQRTCAFEFKWIPWSENGNQHMTNGTKKGKIFFFYLIFCIHRHLICLKMETLKSFSNWEWFAV